MLFGEKTIKLVEASVWWTLMILYNYWHSLPEPKPLSRRQIWDLVWKTVDKVGEDSGHEIDYHGTFAGSFDANLRWLESEGGLVGEIDPDTETLVYKVNPQVAKELINKNASQIASLLHKNVESVKKELATAGQG